MALSRAQLYSRFVMSGSITQYNSAAPVGPKVCTISSQPNNSFHLTASLELAMGDTQAYQVRWKLGARGDS